MKFVLITLATAMLASSVLAQGTSVGSSYLKFPLTARAAGLAESVIADRDHFSSILVNPASLFTSPKTEIMFSHTAWIQDVNTEHLGVRFPFYGTMLGISISSNTVQGIEIRTIPGEPIATFSAQFANMAVSFAASLGSDIVAGTSVKYLYEKIYVDQTTGYAVDIGMMYETKIPGVVAAASLTNVGSVSGFRRLPGELPSRLHLGASYSVSFADLRLNAYPAYVSNLDDITSYFSFGLEAQYKDFLALRSGYHGGSDARRFSAGMGIIYRSIGVDYAFVPFSFGLGVAHLATISFAF